MLRRAFFALVAGVGMTRAAAALPGDSTVIGKDPFGPQSPPDCDTPDRCAYVRGGMTSTLLGCGPVIYGRDGSVKALPSPCNTTTTNWQCQTCGKQWEEKTSSF